MIIASSLTTAFRIASAALAIVLGLLPLSADARSLDFNDLIGEELRQREERFLEENKLDSFRNPELLEVWRSTITAFFVEDFAATERHARTLIDRAPDAPQGHHMLGLALANQGRIDAAIEALDRASAIYDVNAGPLIVKGDLLAAQGNVAAARDAFLAATERDPGDWRAHESLAGLALSEGDAAASLAHHERAADTAPQALFEPRVRLAALYAEAERLDDARRVLQAFMDANPDQPEALVALGRLEFSDGRNDEAARLFDAAIALAPDAPQFRLFKARAELNATRFDEAEETLRAGIAAFPQDAALQMELGGLLGVTRDYDGALAAFEEGVRKWPDAVGFRAGASQAAYRIEDYATALAHAEALATRDAATAGDHFWHAVVLERLDRTEPAIAAYEKAVAGDGSNWIALNNLASLITETDPGRATDLARRAAELSDGNGQVRSTLGWALYSAGEREEALDLFQDLAAVNPDDASVAYRLGRILLESGEAEAGRSELIRALEIDDNFRHALDARRLLSEN